MGRIYQISECLFFWREHPSSYTQMYYGTERENTIDRLRAELTWWSKEKGTYFPHWINCVEYFRSVKRVQLKFYERLLCYAKIFEWIRDEGYQFMATDILLLLMENSKIARKSLPLLMSVLKKPRRSPIK